MQNGYHYLPLSAVYFSVLIGIFLILLLLIQLRILRYVYMRLGVGSGTALALLFGSLIGSYFNIPVAQIPGAQVLSRHYVDVYGMRYTIPVITQWPGTLIAVNVGGAVIPTAMSLYLLLRYQLWSAGLLAVAIVAIACHWMAQPVPGLSTGNFGGGSFPW